MQGFRVPLGLPCVLIHSLLGPPSSQVLPGTVQSSGWLLVSAKAAGFCVLVVAPKLPGAFCCWALVLS